MTAPYASVPKSRLCIAGEVLAWVGGTGAVASFLGAVFGTLHATAVAAGLTLMAMAGAFLVHLYCPSGT